MNKNVIWRQCGLLMACVILPSGFAVAQSDGALDITGQLGATLDQSTSPPTISADDAPQFSLDTDAADSGIMVADDTDAIIFPISDPASDTASDMNNDTDTDTLTTTSRNVPSVSLSNKDPTGVMLATIGINTQARGVLSRTPCGKTVLFQM